MLDPSSTVIYVALIVSGTILALKAMDLAFQFLVLRMNADKPVPPKQDVVDSGK